MPGPPRLRSFFQDPTTTKLYTLSLHDALPISKVGGPVLLKCENLQRAGSFKIRGAYTRIARLSDAERANGVVAASAGNQDRKSTRLNSSHVEISYAVFCLKKKMSYARSTTNPN